MKRSGFNIHDVLYACIFLSLIGVTIFHMLSPPEKNGYLDAAIMVSVEKETGTFSVGDRVLVGSHGAEVIGVSDKRILIISRGVRRGGRFLLGGTKYVLKNQPITIAGHGIYVNGRAERIIF